MADIKTELANVEAKVKAILDGNFTKNEMNGRLLEVWGIVCRINKGLL